MRIGNRRLPARSRLRSPSTPRRNGGERGEISIKGANSGRIDIEVRYVMERGVSGFYTYAQYTHPAAIALPASAKTASSLSR